MSADRADDPFEQEPLTPGEAEAVVAERKRMAAFVSSLTPGDIQGGGWFAKLLTVSMRKYMDKVDATYLFEKYPGVPRDAIVEKRIRLAVRYAGAFGGSTALAYSGAVAATIGTLGGASPLTVSAGVSTLLLDVASLTQLQLRLAYDIAVLYGVPLDFDDPEDLWKLIRVALTVKAGELLRSGTAKVAPAMARQVLKKYYAGAVLAAAKGIPFVGRYLLQRTVIKIAIPLVGVPISVVMNRWTTGVAGRHAREVFRREAVVLETAEQLMRSSRYPRLLLWVAHFIEHSSGQGRDEEALLIREMTRLADDLHQVREPRLSEIIQFDAEDLWSRLAETGGDLGELITAAEKVAAIDGPANARERVAIDELRSHCRRPNPLSEPEPEPER